MYALYINLKKTESLAEMLSLGCGDSSAVGCGQAGWPTTTNSTATTTFQR